MALGGEFRYFSACEAFYLHESGDAHGDAQAELDFLFLLHADGATSASASETETAYQRACARRISCIGGDQALCNKNSTSSWAAYVKSVDTTPGPGLTNAYYLLNANLLRTWHPIKHPVVRDASVAYIAWSGLTKLFEFYETTRAVLTKIVEMEDPKCYVSDVGDVVVLPWIGPEPGKLTCGTTPYKGKYNFKTSSCVEFGPTGNPQTAVANPKAWAYSTCLMQLCSTTRI